MTRVAQISDGAEPRLLVVIGGPRTGSSALGQLLNAHRGVDYYGEIFNPNALLDQHPVRRRLIEQLTGSNQGTSRNVRWRDICEKSPLSVVEKMFETSRDDGRSVVLFKLFDRHLDWRFWHDLMRLYRPVVLTIHREPIDAFISLKKARMTRAWQAVDTTDLKPTLSVKEFLRWREAQQDFYQIAHWIVRRSGVPAHSEISYQDLFASDRNPHDVLMNRLASSGLEFGERIEAEPRASRQDKALSRAEKVANWADFEAELKKRDLQDTLYAYDLEGTPAAVAAKYYLARALPAPVRDWRVHLGRVKRNLTNSRTMRHLMEKKS